MTVISSFVTLIGLFLAFCIPNVLKATDLKPWTETDFVLYPRLDYLYQHFRCVDQASHNVRYSSNEHFYTLALLGCYSPWCLESELTLANTEQKKYGIDNYRLTGRYQLLSDIVLDPVSLMVGCSYSKVPKSALRNFSSFHHGRNELEFHVSLGKERTCYDSWSSRWWTVALFGVADHGSPWWRMEAFFESKFWQSCILRLFAKGLLGMGGNSLDINDFKGYGPIRHRSLQLGIRLTLETHCRGVWCIQYARRIYAYNFPKNTDLFKICVIYPFSL